MVTQQDNSGYAIGYQVGVQEGHNQPGWTTGLIIILYRQRWVLVWNVRTFPGGKWCENGL